MAIDERIRFIRNLKGITQKWLGKAVGFDEKTADVCMAQYESGTRTPKANLVADIAAVLDVDPQALDVPNIENNKALMHTLFAIEDIYGVNINKVEGVICLTLDKAKGVSYLSMFDTWNAWYDEAEKMRNGDITKEEYDNWRYNYPRVDAGGSSRNSTLYDLKRTKT